MLGREEEEEEEREEEEEKKKGAAHQKITKVQVKDKAAVRD